MPEFGPRSTPAKRSADNVISFGMGVLLFLALTIWAALNHHPGWAVVAGLVTLGAAFVTFKGSFAAPCPVCGQSIDELSENGAVQCPNCFAYSVMIQKQFHELDPGATKYGPFMIPLPPSLRMPPVCCACGAPATRTRRVSQSVNLADVPGLPPPGSVKQFELDLPVCDVHEPGVTLRPNASRNRIGLQRVGIIGPTVSMTKSPLYVAMEVRSYRFYGEFIRLNEMDRL